MDSNTQLTVQKMNASWYNYLTTAFGMDPNTFKLAQGSLGLQTADSSGLFIMADSVPPDTSLFDAGGMGKFSQSYANLLVALLPETGSDLPTLLGDNYINWINFRNNYFKTPPTTPVTQAQIFAQFANQYLDPQVATKAISAYNKQALSQWNVASDAYNNPANIQNFVDGAGNTSSLRKYTPVIANATTAINQGASLQINYDSEEAESSLSQTQISAAASGFFDIFSGGAGFDSDQLNTKASSQKFTIAGTIGKYATVAVQRGGWFNAAEFSRAYTAKNDNTVWDPNANAGTWESFFDQPDGSLARHVSQLLLVSDYKITVTSFASYSQEDYLQIKTKASFGIWPFFSGTVSATHTTDVTLNSQSQLVTTFTLNKGLIQIWGVNTLNTPQ
jgi:hypothetical protein